MASLAGGASSSEEVDYVAIDIGNFNSAVVFVGSDGIKHTMTFGNNSRDVIPTQVHLDVYTNADGTKSVELTCEDIDDDDNRDNVQRFTILGFKSLIGASSVPNDDWYKSLERDFNFRYEIDGGVPVVVPVVSTDDYEWMPIDIKPATKVVDVFSTFLEYILMRVRQVGVVPTRTVVCMTVPANASMAMKEVYKNQVKAVWPDARVITVSEHLAAYLDHTPDDMFESLTTDMNIAIFDLGHGTNDFGLMKVARDHANETFSLDSCFPESDTDTAGRMFDVMTRVWMNKRIPKDSNTGVRGFTVKEATDVKCLISCAAMKNKPKVNIRPVLSSANKRLVDLGSTPYECLVNVDDYLKCEGIVKKLDAVKKRAKEYVKLVRRKGISKIDHIIIVGGGSKNFGVPEMIEEGVKAYFPDVKRMLSTTNTASIVNGALRYARLTINDIVEHVIDADDNHETNNVNLREQTATRIGFIYVDEDNPSITRFYMLIDKHVHLPVVDVVSTMRMKVHDVVKTGNGQFVMKLELVEGDFEHQGVVTPDAKAKVTVFSTDAKINSKDTNRNFSIKMTLNKHELCVEMVAGKSITRQELRRVEGALMNVVEEEQTAPVNQGDDPDEAKGDAMDDVDIDAEAKDEDDGNGDDDDDVDVDVNPRVRKGGPKTKRCAVRKGKGKKAKRS